MSTRSSCLHELAELPCPARAGSSAGGDRRGRDDLRRVDMLGPELQLHALNPDGSMKWSLVEATAQTVSGPAIGPEGDVYWITTAPGHGAQRIQLRAEPSTPVGTSRARVTGLDRPEAAASKANRCYRKVGVHLTHTRATAGIPLAEAIFARQSAPLMSLRNFLFGSEIAIHRDRHVGHGNHVKRRSSPCRALVGSVRQRDCR